MPGVPPDALAQVKRGLKGLFGRKKRAHAQAQADPSSSQQQQLQVPSQTTSEAQNPTITTTAPSPLPGQNAEQKTRIDDGFPPPPPGPPPHNNDGRAPSLPSQAQQISEPASVGEAKNIDLDPSSTSAPSTTAAPTATSTTPADTPATTTTETTAPSATSRAAATPADSKPAVDPNGMSATSGPLDDSMGIGTYEPGKTSVDDADGSKFLQKERDLENDMPVEDVQTGQGTTNSPEVKDSNTTTKT